MMSFWRRLMIAWIGSLFLLPVYAQSKEAIDTFGTGKNSNSILGNINSFHKKYQTFFEEKLGFDPDLIGNPSLFNKVGEWIGTPYRYQGSSRRGINCSSFVSMLYSYLYNIELKGSSRDIFKDNVVPIPKDSLQESDLIFFKIRKKNISHVGIYLGNNKFAHATRGKGVIVSDLGEEYYKKYFYSAGRVKDLLAIPLLFFHF